MRIVAGFTPRVVICCVSLQVWSVLLQVVAGLQISICRNWKRCKMYCVVVWDRAVPISAVWCQLARFQLFLFVYNCTHLVRFVPTWGSFNYSCLCANWHGFNYSCLGPIGPTWCGLVVRFAAPGRHFNYSCLAASGSHLMRFSGAVCCHAATFQKISDSTKKLRP